jgi:hypothetical protein
MKPSAIAHEIANGVVQVYARRSPNATPSITFVKKQSLIIAKYAAKLLRNRGFKAEAYRSGTRLIALHVRACA